MKFIVFLFLLDLVSSYQIRGPRQMFLNFGYLVSQLCFQHCSITEIRGASNEKCFVPSASTSTVSLVLKMFLFLDKITVLTSNEHHQDDSDKVQWSDHESQAKVWNRFLDTPKKDGSGSLFSNSNSFRKKYKQRIDSLSDGGQSQVEQAKSKPENITDIIFENIVNAMMSATNYQIQTTTIRTTSTEYHFEDPVTVGMNKPKNQITEDDNSLNILKFISNAGAQVYKNGQVEKVKKDFQSNANVEIANKPEWLINNEQEPHKYNLILKTLFDEQDHDNTHTNKEKKFKLSNSKNHKDIFELMKEDFNLKNEPYLTKNKKTSLISNNVFLNDNNKKVNSMDDNKTNVTYNNDTTIMNNSPKSAEAQFSSKNESGSNKYTNGELKYNMSEDTSSNRGRESQDVSNTSLNVKGNYFTTMNETVLEDSTECVNLFNNTLYEFEDPNSSSQNIQFSYNTTNSPKSADVLFPSNNQSDVKTNVFEEMKYNTSDDYGNNVTGILLDSSNMTNSPKAADVLFPSNNQSDVKTNVFDEIKYNISDENGNNVTGILLGSTKMTSDPKAAESPFSCKNQSNDFWDLKSSAGRILESMPNTNINSTKTTENNVNKGSFRITVFEDPKNRSSDSTDKLKVNASVLVKDANGNVDDDRGSLDQNSLLHILESLDTATEPVGTEDINKNLHEPEPVLKDLDRENVDDSMKDVLNTVLGFKNADENIIWKENKAPYGILNTHNGSPADENVAFRDSKIFGKSKKLIQSPKECVTIYYNENNKLDSENNNVGQASNVNSPIASETKMSSNNQSVSQNVSGQIAELEKVNVQVTSEGQNNNKNTSQMPALNDSKIKSTSIPNSKMISISTDPNFVDKINVKTNILVKDFSNGDKKDSALENLSDNNLLLQILEGLDPILLDHADTDDLNKKVYHLEPEGLVKDATKENDVSIKDVLSNILGIKQPDVRVENKRDVIDLHADEGETFTRGDKFQ